MNGCGGDEGRMPNLRGKETLLVKLRCRSEVSPPALFFLFIIYLTNFCPRLQYDTLGAAVLILLRPRRTLGQEQQHQRLRLLGRYLLLCALGNGNSFEGRRCYCRPSDILGRFSGLEATKGSSGGQRMYFLLSQEGRKGI